MSSKKNKANAHVGQYFPEFKAQTRNQAEYVRSVAENTITIVDGPSGSGKSFMAIGLACEYYITHKIDSILYSRTIVSAGEDTIGFLPGDVTEKTAPYFWSGVDYFNYFLTKQKAEELIHYGHIKCYPTELLRGHTYHKSFMILDEGQNLTPKQLKLFMSRMGKDTKMVILGDINQSDTSYNGLRFLLDKFGGIPSINFVKLDKSDILRNGLIGEILTRFESHGV